MFSRFFNLLYHSFFFSLFIISCLLAQHQHKEIQFFLCLDSIKNGAFVPRYFYTYINGKKTDCMLREDLAAFLFEKNKLTDSSSMEFEKKEAAIKQKKNEYLSTKNFANSDLRNEDFCGADLRFANFSNANLESADLRNADLRNANLRGANLKNAFLKGADLRNADISDAQLIGAYLSNANLKDVKGVTMITIRQVRTLYGATMDSVMMEEVRTCCKEKLQHPGWYWHENEWADWRAKKRGKKL